jgi:hypothetical protein
MGNFWSNDSTRNGASSSCSCSRSATDFGFPQIAIDRNIEIIWGVCTLQSTRNNIFFAFPRAGKYKGKKEAHSRDRDMNSFPCDMFSVYFCACGLLPPLFSLPFLF